MSVAPPAWSAGRLSFWSQDARGRLSRSLLLKSVEKNIMIQSMLIAMVMWATIVMSMIRNNDDSDNDINVVYINIHILHID